MSMWTVTGGSASKPDMFWVAERGQCRANSGHWTNPAWLVTQRSGTSSVAIPTSGPRGGARSSERQRRDSFGCGRRLFLHGWHPIRGLAASQTPSVAATAGRSAAPFWQGATGGSGRDDTGDWGPPGSLAAGYDPRPWAHTVRHLARPGWRVRGQRCGLVHHGAAWFRERPAGAASNRGAL
jgi:hypothetical protein